MLNNSEYRLNRLSNYPAKNNTSDKDFLIISFNEGSKDYTKSNLDEIMSNISGKNPKIIFVCTQESKSGSKTHFQHVFEERLYAENQSYKRLYKVDGSKTSIIGDKNCRTRIYYDSSSIENNMVYVTPRFFGEPSINGKYSKKTLNNLTENEYYKNNGGSSTNRYQITSFGKYISKTSGLSSARNGTLFKASIFTRVELKDKNGEPYKFIVINSHLFFQPPKLGDTGLQKRSLEFLSLINELKLAKLFEQGYNIFFCGDLNFRLSVSKYALNKIPIPQQYILEQASRNGGFIEILNEKFNIKNELNYLLNVATLNNQRQIESNTILNQLVRNKIISQYSTNFELFKHFKHNLKLLGLPLTCRLVEKRYEQGKENKYHCSSNNSKEGEFSCTKKNKITKKITPRIPSNCDKILFALNNLLVDRKDFIIPQFPDESDHKLISLYGTFYDNPKPNHNSNHLYNVPLN